MRYEGVKVGMNIRQLRTNKGLSIAKLSEKVNRSVSHMNMVELGHRKISLDMLYELMEAFETDANSILGVSFDNKAVSVDSMLLGLSKEQRDYIVGTVSFMIQNLAKVAS